MEKSGGSVQHQREHLKEAQRRSSSASGIGIVIIILEVNDPLQSQARIPLYSGYEVLLEQGRRPKGERRHQACNWSGCCFIGVSRLE